MTTPKTNAEMMLEKLDALIAEARKTNALLAARQAGAAPSAAPEVASAAELDSAHGDPTVRFDPRFWTGDSMAGKRYSQCPAEGLDMVADDNQWKADNPRKDVAPEDAAKYAGYSRLDARRARGWAARIRGGWTGLVDADREDRRAPTRRNAAPATSYRAETGHGADDDGPIPF